MGDAGSGEGVGGSPDRVARMERSAIRDSLRGSPAPGLRSAPPGLRAALHPGYELPRMAARIKFPLAEWPEHGYTAKIALTASFS
jgi:hypothetical protein